MISDIQRSSPRSIWVIATTSGISFEDFYRREFPRLAGSLRIVCGDITLAEELSQEAFTRALNHWHRVGLLDSPSGWLYRTAFNLLRRHWKRHKKSEEPLVISVQLASTTASGGSNERIDLVKLLGQLPFSQRQAVVLRHVLDYSTEETAELLEVSQGALRMTLHRAVQTLRKNSNLIIEDDDYLEGEK